MSFTDSIKDTLLILNAIRHENLEYDALLQNVGIDPVLLSDPESRIGSKINTQLLQSAIEMSGNQYFAVQSGNTITKFPVSLYYMLVVSSATLLDAAYIAARHYSLQSEASTLLITEENDKVFVRFFRKQYNNIDPRHYVEFVFSCWMRSIKENISPDAIPEEVHFKAPKPHSVAAYEDYFKCPVYFSQHDNQLVWKKQVMELPNKNYDPELKVVLQRYASIQMKKLDKKDEFIEKVYEVIANQISNGNFSLQSIAEELNIAPRTLQYRLNKKNKTFKELTDDIRKDIALSYLEDMDISIREITLVLGFSELKSFYRAFNRWTGTTPAEYRRKTDQ